MPKYKRILLKISGEALSGENGYGISDKILIHLSEEIKKIHELGVEIAIVVGGGNIFRGIEGTEMGVDRATGDYMGMLATIINSLALQNSLEKKGMDTRVQTSIEMRQIAEPYIRRRAIRHLEKRRIVIFGGGTGNPFFTTDTAAALRAIEIDAEVLLKATDVDGIYNKDPKKFKDAKKFEVLNFSEAYEKNLKIMDLTAFSLCKDNNLPIIVFNLFQKEALLKIINGEKIGTIVKGDSNESSNW